jgi:hypothetical protein
MSMQLASLARQHSLLQQKDSGTSYHKNRLKTECNGNTLGFSSHGHGRTRAAQFMKQKMKRKGRVN